MVFGRQGEGSGILMPCKMPGHQGIPTIPMLPMTLNHTVAQILDNIHAREQTIPMPTYAEGLPLEYVDVTQARRTLPTVPRHRPRKFVNVQPAFPQPSISIPVNQPQSFANIRGPISPETSRYKDPEKEAFPYHSPDTNNPLTRFQSPVLDSLRSISLNVLRLKPFPQIDFNPTVTLIWEAPDGSYEVKFEVHRDLLCYFSPVFRKRFMFKKPEERVMGRVESKMLRREWRWEMEKDAETMENGLFADEEGKVKVCLYPACYACDALTSTFIFKLEKD